jgi:tRNA (guanine37-N1)-methyltransferase
MRFEVVTIFPAMFEETLRVGIVGRAFERGALTLKVHDLRDFTTDRHRVVDDLPFGGGPGMVLKVEPLFRALNAIEAEAGAAPHVILTSPQGTRFTHSVAQRLSRETHLVVLCGRYEGIDERVRLRVSEELSIGDYVLSGGEIPALVVIDAVARLVPGVVGDEQSVEEESFIRGLLDFPHYTRPAHLAPEFGDSTATSDGAGMNVPEVLLSGNHADIRRWRKQQAIARTLARRPDLLSGARLDDEEREILRELIAHDEQTADN